MEKIQLAAMNLSHIILGCDRCGGSIKKDDCYGIIDEYIKAGGNMLDTARLYADGESEKIIGEYLEQTNSRSKVYISTKCAHPNIETMHKNRLGRDDILSDVEKSLKSLKTDYIDILWLHRDDISVDVKPIINTLNKLINEGTVKYIGASNWTHTRIIMANKYASENGLKGFLASQILYNPAKANESWDDTLVAMHDEGEREFYETSKMPVFAFSSQAKGFFEKYAAGTLSQKSKDRYYNNENIQTYSQIKKYADENNITVSNAVIKTLINKSNFDVFPIIGPSNINQLKETLNIM